MCGSSLNIKDGYEGTREVEISGEREGEKERSEEGEVVGSGDMDR